MKADILRQIYVESGKKLRYKRNFQFTTKRMKDTKNGGPDENAAEFQPVTLFLRALRDLRGDIK
jgi:hypothetical protein